MLLLALLLFAFARALASPVHREFAPDVAPPTFIDNILSAFDATFKPIIHTLTTATIVHTSAIVSAVEGQHTEPLRPRTPLTIIWNCFATIAACTVFAMHPNIPKTNTPLHTRHWERLLITLDALLRPEAVIFWAMRQLVVARRIKQRFKDAEWTVSHGFFVEMGGLVLVDGDEMKVITMDGNGMVYVGTSAIPSEPEIKADHSIHAIEHGVTRPSPDSVTRYSDLPFIIPCVTKEEILDKGKGDSLSKAFVILQTSWFILQCMARRERELAVTELELITSAYAALNVVTYGLWWSKPRNAGSSIYFNREGKRVPPPKSSSGSPSVQSQSDSNSTPMSNSTLTPSSTPTSKSKSNTQQPESFFSEPYRSTDSPEPMSEGEKENLDKQVDNQRKRVDASPPTRTQEAITQIKKRLQRIKKAINVFLKPIFNRTSHTLAEIQYTATRRLRVKTIIKQCVIILSYSVLAAFLLVLLAVTATLAWGGAAVFLAIFALFLLASIFGVYLLASLVAIPLSVFKHGNYLSLLRLDTPREVGSVGNHYAGKLGHRDSSKTRVIFVMSIIPCLCGMIFGAIHLLAWNFPFASEQERSLWRMASVFVTVEPLWVSYVEVILRGVFEKVLSKPQWTMNGIIIPLIWKWKIEKALKLAKVWHTISALASLLLRLVLLIVYSIFYIRPMVYGLIRLYIFVQALLALRNLPDSALETVDWSSFLPHF